MVPTDHRPVRLSRRNVDPKPAVMKAIEAAQLKTIRQPADGKYFGNWKDGEKIAVSGRGLTWSDKTPHNNGGGCYNCHQMSHKEIAFGTIGPSLLNYGKLRGNGDAGILTEAQMKHLMAYLFDPESPVNKE